MYNRVKFLLYGSVFLFFILLFTAIQQSSTVADKKAQEKIEQDMINKVEKYQKIAEEQNSKQIQEKSQTSQDFEQMPMQPPRTETPVTNNIQQNEKPDNELEIENNQTTQTTEKLYYASNNAETTDYLLCKRFQFEGNNFAIIAFDDTSYTSEYSKFVNRKFYIYKELEQNLTQIHYLFEKSVQKDSASLPDFSVVVNKYDVKITYNSKPPVNRTVNRNLLINASKQYNDMPVLTTINPESDQNSDSKLNTKTSAPDKDIPELTPIEPEN